MMEFIVEKSPSDELTLSNCAAVNGEKWKDFIRQQGFTNCDYVKLNGRDFKVSQEGKSMRPDHIGIGGLQREWIGTDIGRRVKAIPVVYNDPSQYLYQIVVELSFYPKEPRKTPSPFDSDQLAKVFREEYCNIPFTTEQRFIIRPDSTKSQLLKGRIILLVGTNPDMLQKGTSGKGKKLTTGLLTQQTLVKFEKLEGSVLHLTGSARGSSTQASIISPDWDYSQMGIGGLDHEFSTIFRRAFASRVFPAELVEKLGCKHVRGMLLYGPPGTGKTLIARQIGKMLNAKEIQMINGPEILNKFVGESEANIRKLFAGAEEDQKNLGKASGLHIIIFDEIDSICKERGTVGGGTGVHDTVVNQLLAKLDGVEQLDNILLIGMTNRRDLMDDALLRPGRLDVQLEIGLPDKDGRLEILQIHTAHMRSNNKLDGKVDLKDLAEKTRNFSGAEIEGLVKSAANTAMNKLIKFKDGIKFDSDVVEKIKVTKEDFEQALMDVKPALGVSNEQLDTYIRNGIVDWSPVVDQILEKGQMAIKQAQFDKLSSLTSLIIHGNSGCGKTALAAQLAQDCGFPFVKVATPEHMIGFSDIAKCQAIKKVFDDAYRSSLSCIVIDDIDQLLDYVSIGPRFSNAVVQTLKVLLKKRPTQDHDLLIIGTTSNYLVLKEMGLASCFTYQVDIPYLTEPEHVLAVLKELKYFKEEQLKILKKSLAPLKVYIGIKKLISIMGASMQATGRTVESAFLDMLEEEGCVLST